MKFGTEIQKRIFEVSSTRFFLQINLSVFKDFSKDSFLKFLHKQLILLFHDIFWTNVLIIYIVWHFNVCLSASIFVQGINNVKIYQFSRNLDTFLQKVTLACVQKLISYARYFLHGHIKILNICFLYALFLISLCDILMS